MLEALSQRLNVDGVVTFSARIHPGAPRTRIKETLADGTVKIDIAAVPEDGKANTELVRFLAKEFDVPRSHIEIVTGHLTKTKVVRIRGAELQK